MRKYDEKIWFLITRQLAGEATEAEQQQLKRWMDEDPKHRSLFKKIESSWEKRPRESADSSLLFNYESGLEKLRGKLAEERSSSEGELRSELGGAFAGSSRREPEYGRPVRSGRSRTHAWRLAAVVLSLVVASSVYLTLWFWEDTSHLIYSTSDIEQRIITLPDGSITRLNSNSRLEVPADYRESGGEIRLEGEAFFDVIHDPDRPFAIRVDEALVRVLGTSFSVKRGAKIIVAVQEGVVSLRHMDLDERSALQLRAGQLGLLSGDGTEIRMEEASVENYLSWMNGYLRFESMPFDQVLRQLERIYDIGYELEDPAIRSLQLTVYTERMEMHEVLETIAMALDLKYEIAGNEVRWMRSGSE